MGLRLSIRTREMNKPKYKIGDVVVVEDNYLEHQYVIVSARGCPDFDDESGKPIHLWKYLAHDGVTKVESLFIDFTAPPMAIKEFKEDEILYKL